MNLSGNGVVEDFDAFFLQFSRRQFFQMAGHVANRHIGTFIDHAGKTDEVKICRVSLPFVRALIDFFRLGLRIPNFMSTPSFYRISPNYFRVS